MTKIIMFLLALLPFAATAQKAKQTKDAPLKSIALHYEKNMVINYNHVRLKDKMGKSEIDLPGPGDMNFGKDEGISLAQKAANAAKQPDWDKGYMTAENVKISCPAYPDLKGDKFVYDDNTAQAMLSGHVRIVDNCGEKQIGDKVYLDFSDDNYKILGIK